MSLNRLIAEAVVLGGGKHQCAELGHVWITEGGRACPRGGYWMSQTVYVCKSCGEWDYGDKGGPGYRDCYDEGPCSYTCSADDASDVTPR